MRKVLLILTFVAIFCGIAIPAHANSTAGHFNFVPGTTWCMQANSGFAQLEGCGGQSSQDWTYFQDGFGGSYGELQVGITGKCLTDPGEGANNFRLTLTTCNARPDQNWANFAEGSGDAWFNFVVTGTAGGEFITLGSGGTPKDGASIIGLHNEPNYTDQQWCIAAGSC